MKEKNLFELHKKWMKSGKLPQTGLCSSIPEKYTDTLDLFEPDDERVEELERGGKAWAYWGYEGSVHDDANLRCHSYTDLRQTVCLFICAIHEELP